jgi:hypothetical protein
MVSRIFWLLATRQSEPDGNATWGTERKGSGDNQTVSRRERLPGRAYSRFFREEELQ